MEFKFLTYNNRAGIVADAMLLQELVYNNLTQNADMLFTDDFVANPYAQSSCKDSIGIWIQNPCYGMLDKFKKNVWFINEEWSSVDDLKHIDMFDYVVCKSKFAQDLLGKYRSDVICLPLLSYDYYDPNIARTEKFLHFNGKAIQKNTELVMKQTLPITVVDLTQRFSDVTPNFNYITYYMIRRQVKKLLNSHTVHLCPSMYESWGHYLFEGLSTGAEVVCSNIPAFTEHLDPDLVHILPTQESTDISYWYDRDNQTGTFPLRKSYYIDPQVFSDYLENFEPKGRDEERRQLYLDIMAKNKARLIEFFRNA
jgi:hypothetical protein